QLGQGLAFTLEPIEELGTFGAQVLNGLDSHICVESGMPGFVHMSHGSLSELCLYLVFADPFHGWDTVSRQSHVTRLSAFKIHKLGPMFYFIEQVGGVGRELPGRKL